LYNVCYIIEENVVLEFYFWNRKNQTRVRLLLQDTLNGHL